MTLTTILLVFLGVWAGIALIWDRNGRPTLESIAGSFLVTLVLAYVFGHLDDWFPSAAEPERVAEQCGDDAGCWGTEVAFEASFECKQRVEQHARYTYEWTDGFFGSGFSRARWADRQQRVITLIGDAVRMQNGFGAWQPVTYWCDYDIRADRVVAVRLRPGPLR